MTRAARKLTLRITLLGVLLTLAVAAVDWGGGLRPLEWWFYDWRAKLCQHYTPPPSGDVLHLDIDDASLGAVGRWPWSRATQAMILDEIRTAGASAVALDILYAEPEEEKYMPGVGTGFEKVDPDARLTEAVERFGKVLVPVSFDFKPRPPTTPAQAAAVVELRR